jgi:hypothetical protein
MESWYGLFWKHKNRHGELLRAAERERVANQLLSRGRTADHPVDTPADRAERDSRPCPVPSGNLRRAAEIQDP